MTISDTPTGYGSVSRALHWTMAAAIFALFGLGLWMVGLDYYSPYYTSAPDLHRSIGIVLFIALVLRTGWRLGNVKPDDSDLPPLARTVSRTAHRAFYVLLFVLTISGYFISTSDGRPIDVFGLFHVPSLLQSQGLEDAAGLVHRWTAYGIMALASIHACAAIWHHTIDRRQTLNRMWSGRA
jgi:cytochrome b561